MLQTSGGIGFEFRLPYQRSWLICGLFLHTPPQVNAKIFLPPWKSPQIRTIKLLHTLQNNSMERIPACSSGFSARLVCWCFVEELALGRIFLWVLRFFPVSIITPMLHSYSFVCHWRCIILAIDRVLENAGKRLPEFFINPRYTPVATIARHLFLSWARKFQSTLSHPIYLRQILILSFCHRVVSVYNYMMTSFVHKAANSKNFNKCCKN